jgi:hypothetical protein
MIEGHFDSYIYTLLGFNTQDRGLDLAVYPPTLCRELGRQLGLASQQLSARLRSHSQYPPSLVKHTSALVKAAALLARNEACHDTLSECDVTSHLTTIAMALLSHQLSSPSTTITSSTTHGAEDDGFLALMTSFTTPYIQTIFAPGQAWIQTPALSVSALELSMTLELDILDIHFGRCLARLDADHNKNDKHDKHDKHDGSENTDNSTSDISADAAAAALLLSDLLCVLNAWMRCAGERAQLVLMHQPLRTKILRVARRTAVSVWIDELLVVLLACLPLAAENPEAEEYFAARALVSGLLGQIADPGAAFDPDVSIRGDVSHEVHLSMEHDQVSVRLSALLNFVWSFTCCCHL